jgi:hypothetical protein
VVRSQPRQIVFETLSQKKTITKTHLGVAQGVGPELKPQYRKKKKKKKKLEVKVIETFLCKGYMDGKYSCEKRFNVN